MKIVFITDSWKTLDHPSDTSLRLMVEALKLKVDVYWARYTGVLLDGSTPKIFVKRLLGLKTGTRRRYDFRFTNSTCKNASYFDQIHYRVDPPVDPHYEIPLRILAFDPKVSKKVVNPVLLLLKRSEKFDGLLLPEHSPKSVVSARRECLEYFLKKHSKVVLKPVNSAQSLGVKLITRSNIPLLKKATHGFTQAVMLQEFIPAIAHGETRLWFLDGSLLTAVRKVPQKNSVIIDMDHGASLTTHSLTAGEKKVVQKLSVLIKRKKIRLVAIDLIGEKITDFNFTSPGLIVQMEKLLGTNLAAPIVKALCSRAPF